MRAYACLCLLGSCMCLCSSIHLFVCVCVCVYVSMCICMPPKVNLNDSVRVWSDDLQLVSESKPRGEEHAVAKNGWEPSLFIREAALGVRMCVCVCLLVCISHLRMCVCVCVCVRARMCMHMHPNVNANGCVRVRSDGKQWVSVPKPRGQENALAEREGAALARP